METTIVKPRAFQLTNKSKERLINWICLICVFLFVYTAYSKLMDHDRFLKGLTRVHPISGFAVYLSWFVPIAEITVSTLLIIPKTIRFGLYSFTALMIIFTSYIISMLLWAEKLPCHCGGVIEKLSWVQHVWFNLAFIAIAIFALWLSKTKTNS
jgi:hypothetical protein